MDLTVYREFEGTYQIVGRLSNEAGKTMEPMRAKVGFYRKAVLLQRIS